MQLLFDRGTLIFRLPSTAQDSFDLSQLPGVLWDPRVAAFLQRHLLPGSFEILTE